MFEKFLHQTPFFRLVLPLILGIIFQINFSLFNEYIYHFLTGLFLISVLLSVFKFTRNYRINKLWGLNISLFLFAVGMHLVYQIQTKEYHFNKPKQEFIATIIEQAQEKENSVKTVLKIDYIKDSAQWMNNNTRLLCYFQKDSSTLNLTLGDQIISECFVNEIKHSGNPYAFNYKTYLKYKEIYHQCYIQSDAYQIIDYNKGSRIRLLSNKVRQNLLSIYQENDITGNEFAVLSALTLGYKNELTPELKESFSTSGAMHILAVSGLHVGIIFIILGKLLFFLQRNRYGKIIQSVIIITILFFYAFLTGLSDSVLRATVMFSFISIGKMFTRQVNIYNTISASAFILLIINPYSLMNVGFQLSYAAVISIVFFQPKIYSLLNFNRTIPDYIWQLISVALAAQLGTFPITIYYFDQFPLYFILSNIVIIPVATIIIYGAVILFAFSFSQVATKFFALVLKYTTIFLNRSVGFIESLPNAKLDQILIDRIELSILIIFILFLSFYIISKQYKFVLVSIIILACVVFYNILSSYLKLKDNILVIHNIPGNTAINFIKNKRSTLIVDEDLKENLLSIKYNIHPILKEYEIESKHIQTILPTNHLNYYSFNNQSILNIKSDSIKLYNSNQKLKVNYIILSNNINVDLSTLQDYFEFDLVIFDTSNSYYKTQSWQKECKLNHIPCYNVLQNGAFVAYL